MWSRWRMRGASIPGLTTHHGIAAVNDMTTRSKREKKATHALQLHDFCVCLSAI